MHDDDVRTPQPPPLPAEGDVWAEILMRLTPGSRVYAICAARREMGIAKYGVPLQRKNGRNHAVDEAQEHLDAAAYRAARSGAMHPEVLHSLSRALECLDEVDPEASPAPRTLTAEVLGHAWVSSPYSTDTYLVVPPRSQAEPTFWWDYE